MALRLPPRNKKSVLSSHAVRRFIRANKGPKSIIIFILLISLTNWVLFGNAFLGPLGKGSLPSSIKSFYHLMTPAYLDKLQTTYGFQGHDTIPVKTLEIVPDVQDASMLRHLGLDNLFRVEVHTKDSSEEKRYFYTPDYFEEVNVEGEAIASSSSKDIVQKAVVAFKRMGRTVYKGSKSPQIVLVMGLDFQKYEDEYALKVLPNRVNYASKHDYGLYVRWIQEFTPRLQESHNLDTNWWRPLLIREAMSAFPQAKYFWFLDERSLIMRDDLTLESYLLNADSLGKAMLRDQPVILPESAIKTYRNTAPSDVSFIFTQDSYALNTDSIIVKNDMYGKSFLEYWGDNLYRGYSNFADNEVKALTHILQWHPYLLSRTALVPPRMLNSIHTDEKAKKDSMHSYQKGDLVVNFRSCELGNTCNNLAEAYLKDK
ncbi:hypothetical protein FOA43_000062 [Brettanomyces nanus]|uniref:Uncharacterized protein n=1 Tax=Eeniella nana TaxID=13502 RepID=A0A875RVB3_EENNA|nr:uncharacterized protein FOA43_000062 [Brettanomyces nanus]QPG72761.1 hypothetical protein FOA43_000062 [Brettanomyces nanus]